VIQTRGSRRGPNDESEMAQAATCDLPGAETIFLGAAEAGAKESDVALARAAAGGAPAALGDLYVRHSRRVYSLCLRMTHNTADAEDLTHEVFIHLVRNVGSFRGESQFTTWLHRITVNKVLMHFRRTARRAETTEGIGAEIAASHKNQYSSRPQFVNQIALDAALARLPPGYRSVFVLYDIEGYSHQEIAELLGCSVGTSKSQLHKARKRLWRLLKTGINRRGSRAC
jgi:RNA polymerase sigma-70 factor, ECF subfamily